MEEAVSQVCGLLLPVADGIVTLVVFHAMEFSLVLGAKSSCSTVTQSVTSPGLTRQAAFRVSGLNHYVRCL